MHVVKDLASPNCIPKSFIFGLAVLPFAYGRNEERSGVCFIVRRYVLENADIQLVVQTIGWTGTAG